jgi:Acyl-CoA carboxylase epsilon subunit
VSPDPVDAAPDAAAERPVLRVVRGTPDAVELAALVAVVTAAAAGDGPTPRSAGPTWASPSRSVRSTLPTGGWRASFAPR